MQTRKNKSKYRSFEAAHNLIICFDFCPPPLVCRQLFYISTFRSFEAVSDKCPEDVAKKITKSRSQNLDIASAQQKRSSAQQQRHRHNNNEIGTTVATMSPTTPPTPTTTTLSSSMALTTVASKNNIAVRAALVLFKKIQRRRRQRRRRYIPRSIGTFTRRRVSVSDIFRQCGPVLFRRAYRMSYELFCKLSKMLHKNMLLAMERDPTGEKNFHYIPNGPISMSVRLACALRYFAGGSPLDLMTTFQISFRSVLYSVWFVF